VSLVAILDADKEGSSAARRRSCRRSAGRTERERQRADVRRQADRGDPGRLEETNRRRAAQLAYNEEHGITPESIQKGVSDIAELLALESPTVPGRRAAGKQEVSGMSREELEKLVVTLEEEMYVAAEELRFEYAAKLRDEVKELRRELNALVDAPA
jgi:excinuclease ABC subunit B